MVALDLRKAFDTVNHQILLDKLQHYGFTGTYLKWFENDLSDRRQTACKKDVFSEPEQINTGITQGSILGPLLFILYVNDLSVWFKKAKVNMHADDTIVYYSDNTIVT